MRAVQRVSPLAKLLGATVLGVIVVASLDPVTATVALALEVALLPLLALAPRTVWRRVWPLVVAALFAGLTIALYGRTSGTVYAEFLLVRISDGSLALAGTTVVRILAMTLPASLLTARIDVSALAADLSQIARLPARFVMGALAATRLVSVLADDADAIARARRSRGLDDAARGWRKLRLLPLLAVSAIRRAGRLATAMEARGFDGATTRTFVREARFGAREIIFVAVLAAIGVVAVATSIATGWWGWGYA